MRAGVPRRRLHRITIGTMATTMTAMPMVSAGDCSDCTAGNGIVELEGVVEGVESSGDGGDDGGGGDGVGLDEDKRLAIATMTTMIATITMARAHTSS